MLYLDQVITPLVCSLFAKSASQWWSTLTEAASYMTAGTSYRSSLSPISGILKDSPASSISRSRHRSECSRH